MSWLECRKGIYYKGFRHEGRDKYVSLRTRDVQEAQRRLDEPIQMSVRELIRWYDKSTVVTAVNTQRLNNWSWNHVLSHWGDHTPVLSIDALAVDGLDKALKANGLGPTSRCIILRNVRKLLHFAVDKEVLKSHPMRKYRLPESRERKRILSAEEEARMFACIPQAENRRFFELKLQTGLRLGQILQIESAHINWQEKTLLVPKHKRQSERTIPLTPKALEVLTAQLTGKPTDGQVFAGVTATRIEQAWARARTKAGLGGERVVPHTLRHTTATRLTKFLGPHELKEYFGWSTVSLTDKYCHPQLKNLQDKLKDVTQL